MAEQTFRSPGFFEKEVDLTHRAQVVEGVPAGIVGTAKHGPAFVPVTVGSFSDFKSKFGGLDSELFGPYAVNAFLQNKTAVTYVRVLGAGSNTTTTEISTTIAKGTVTNAGFVLKGVAASGGHKGAVQFLSAKHTLQANQQHGVASFTDNVSFLSGASGDIYILRGMLFLASGARAELLDYTGSYPSAGTFSDGAITNTYDGSSEACAFKFVINSSAGSTFANDEKKAGIKIYTASLDPNSDHYITKVLNTSVDNFHRDQHLLYADFPVESELAKVTYVSDTETVHIHSGSHIYTTKSGGDTSLAFIRLFGNFNTRFKTARTTNFISQPFGNKEYDLFYFESLDDGEVGNSRVKVSISNLRRSTDIKNSFPTFTVLVRAYDDTDTNLKILEQYAKCTLDPSDENYVAKKIGDYKVYYNFDAETDSERRLNVTGKYPNKSRYVRIIMNANVADRKIPDETMPFGFRGLPSLKTNDNLTAAIGNSITGIGSKTTKGTTRLMSYVGTDRHDSRYAIVPPVPLRLKCTRGNVSTTGGFRGSPGGTELADSRYFWGVKFERVPRSTSISSSPLNANASGERNTLIDSYAKLLGIDKLDVVTTGSGADAFNSNKFTLARVSLNNQSNSSATLNAAIKTEITGSASDHIKEAAYIRHGVVKLPNYTIQDNAVWTERLTFASLASSTGSKDEFNKFTDYLKFTNMFYGGFDGINILDADQRLLNDRASSVEDGGKAAGGVVAYTNLCVESSPGSGETNNIVNSYRTAGKIITDPMSSRVNIVAIPGIRGSHVTDHISDLTREYSKAIYLMDIPSYNDSLVRLFDNPTTRPNVRKTISKLEGRGIDNNYVATYFPDVIKLDTENDTHVTMPSSIAALGALAYNDSVAFPWFAPAGFNRGALSDVVNTKLRLNAEDRNILYEARINPIATFPQGGFVIFGQKTLQQDRSALDRVNVRRMLLEVKRIVSDIANKYIFEQNTPAARSRFVGQVTPQLAIIQAQQGIDQFKVVMDSSNNSQEDIEQNRLNGRVILVPTRAVEFIAIDFIITNAGVSFE